MKKGITVILALVLALGLGLGGLSIAKNARSNKEFIADGYILDPADEEYVTEGVDTLYYFSQGAKYKEKFGTQILFKDSSGNDNSIDNSHFLHYNDGSLGSFTKGVIMDVSELSESNYGYYSLTKNTVLIKNGSSYEMKSRGESLNISEFIWKISDTDYMLVSPNIALTIGSETVPFPDYVQITYVDNGIVRLSHQQGTYQTVAADSKLVTQGGAELNLVGKNFMIDGEAVLSLDDMSIDDSSYIDIDENVKDQPNIPTFNVINGKDGANGTDGTDGEKGEIGEDGEQGTEGQEGEEGSEGTAGSEGVIGSEGALGQDGVEGNMGTEGLQGNNAPNGVDGKNATNADPNGIKAVDLNARPTVSTLSTDANGTISPGLYDSTPSSATMTLSLSDPDSSIEGYENDLTISLFDRATGKALVYYDSVAGSYKYYNRSTGQYDSSPDTTTNQTITGIDASTASNLASLKEAGFTIGNLSSGTEYELVVSGKYEAVKDSGEWVSGDFIRKVFQTAPLGISLEKGLVTDKQIEAVARIDSGAAIKSYEIWFMDKNGNPIAKHPVDNLGAGARNPFPYTMNESTPVAPADERNGDIASNTVYKAKLANVKAYSGGDPNNSFDVNTDDSVFEIKTLKETPYKKKANPTDPVEQISSLTPTLDMTDNGSYMRLRLAAGIDIEDKDRGIKGYRYELYDANDMTGNLSDITPKYSKELTELTSYSFKLNEGDTTNYIGKIVVVFDDNEKTVELGTNFSNTCQLTGNLPNMTVYFDKVNELVVEGSSKHPDEINGYIVISDAAALNDTSLVKHCTSSHPLTLTFTSENGNTIVQNFSLSPWGHPDAPLADYDTSVAGLYKIKFCQRGLMYRTTGSAVVPYTLVVRGPWDMDGNGTLVGDEYSQVLASIRVTPSDTTPVAIASRDMNVVGQTFAKKLVMTTSKRMITSTDQQYDANYQEVDAKYSLKTMERLELELWQITAVGQTKLGSYILLDDQQAVVSDTQVDKTHDSDFDNQSVVVANVTQNSDMSLSIAANGSNDPTNPGINASDWDGQVSRFTLTPDKFAVANNDTRLFSGADFEIRAVKAYDYAGNEIKINETENVIKFQIQPKHVPSANVNNEVSVTPIQKVARTAGLTSDSEFDGLSDTTVVGIRFNSEYAYADALEVEYRIWEVIGSVHDHDDSIPSDPASENLYKTSSTKITEVMYGTQTIGVSNNYRPLSVELYFNSTNDTVVSANQQAIAWKNPDGSAVSGQKLRRGHKYIISYRIKADNSVNKCNQDSASGSHWYPGCAEKDIVDAPYTDVAWNDVPLYRSKVISLDKQTPVVERYPKTSDANSVSWYYRTIDPDGAIVADVSGKAVAKIYTGNTYDAVVAATTGTDHDLTNIAGYQNAFTEVSLTNSDVAKGKWYSVGIPYKTIDSTSETVHYVKSNPVMNEYLVAPADNKIICKGNKTGGTVANPTYAKALTNEGNYRLKLIVRGEDIDRFAAFKVEITQNTHKVVFDPVFASGTASDGDGKYVYMYIDASPLAAAVGKWQSGDTASTDSLDPAADVTAVVSGYYSTFASGFNSFTAVKDDYNGKTFDTGNTGGEKVYALKSYKADGTARYMEYRGGDIVNTSSGTIAGSLFVPGKSFSSKDGFIVGSLTAGTPATAAIEQRYKASGPIALDDTFADCSGLSGLGSITFDENGAYNAARDEYYTVEALALKQSISFSDSSNVFQIGDILPATNLNRNVVPGATSAMIYVDLYGAGAGATTGANPAAKIYPMLYDATNSKYIKITRTEQQINNVMEYSYEVDKSGGAGTWQSSNIEDYYAQSAFQTNEIKGINSGTPVNFALSLQGLEVSDANTSVPQHEYWVKFFTYDTSGNRHYLYAIDGGKTDYPYEFATLRRVQVRLDDPSYVYEKYDSKSAKFYYSMPADSGRYKVIRYTVTAGSRQIAQGYTTPLSASPTYKYYSQTSTENTPFTISMNPNGSGIRINEDYKVKLEVFEANTSGVISGDPSTMTVLGETEKTFKRTTLDRPSINVVTTISGSTLTVKANCNDPNRVIVGGEYRLILKDNTDTSVQDVEQTVSIYSNTADETVQSTVTFDNLSAGHSYSLKAIAPIDRDNNNVADDTDYENEWTIGATATATANIYASATPSEVSFTVTPQSNFDSVDKVIITVYENTDSRPVIVTYELDSNTISDFTNQFAYNESTEWSGKHASSGTTYLYTVAYYHGNNQLGYNDNQFEVHEN